MDPIVENLLIRWEDTRQSEHPETVESLCRDHPELRPLVEQRIEALRRIYRALSSAPSASDTGLRHGAEALPTIDGYECVAQIGQGGMGVVFRARQIRLGRSVAIKMLRGSFHDRRTLARFRSEAESVAKLKHPNIVQIYDVGEYRGQPYLVLEYTDGGNLHELIRGQPQPQTAAAQLVRDIARALALAHHQGIVHRDIKPANVLLMRGNEASRGRADIARPQGLVDFIPKITDFGIAKDLGLDVQMTGTDELMGTPAYMAPEQTGMGGTNVGPATDVFALGVTLYELLVGRTPFAGPSRIETIQQIQTREPMPPSRIQPEVLRDLENICLKCLEKEPIRRYADAEALADDLDRFLHGSPVLARPIARWQRTWRWCCRNPTTAGLAALLALACTLGLVGVSWKWREAEHARLRAEANYLRAFRAVNDCFDVLGSESSTDAPSVRKLRQKLLSSAAKYYEELSDDLSHTPFSDDEHQHLLASTLMNLANLQYDLKNPAAAKRFHGQALQIWSELMKGQCNHARSFRESSLAHYNLGNTLRALAQYDDAVESYDTSIRQSLILTKSGQGKTLMERCIYNARWGRARALDRLGRHEDAIKDWEYVVEGTAGERRNHMRIELACSHARAGRHALAKLVADEVAAASDVEPGVLGACGRLLSVCAKVANDNADFGRAERVQTVEQYTGLAVAYLEQAISLSSSPSEEILDDVRHHPDFQFLLDTGSVDHLLVEDIEPHVDDAQVSRP